MVSRTRQALAAAAPASAASCLALRSTCPTRSPRPAWCRTSHCPSPRWNYSNGCVSSRSKFMFDCYYLFKIKWNCFFTVILIQVSIIMSAAAPDRIFLKRIYEWMFTPGQFIRLDAPDHCCVNSAAVSWSDTSALLCWQWLGAQPVSPGRGSADSSAQPPEKQAHSGGARLQVRTHAPQKKKMIISHSLKPLQSSWVCLFQKHRGAT